MWVFVVSVSIVFLDQFTKYLIRANLSPLSSMPLINGALHLTYVENSGAAFGIFTNQTVFFIAVSAAAIFFMILLLRSAKSFFMRLAFALILAGAVGNLIDRVRFGFVVDFIDIRIWPVFNVADSAITIGAIILAWQILVKKNAPHTI